MLARVAAVGVVVAAWAMADGSALPDKPGRKLVLHVCTKCHPAETFAPLRMSREEWQAEVAGMIARGARANRTQARQIVDYLAAYLGRK
jgi:cytochrome c5